MRFSGNNPAAVSGRFPRRAKRRLRGLAPPRFLGPETAESASTLAAPEPVLKLDHPFIQLPLAFDAGALAEEIAQFGPEHWRPHPQGYEGNDFLPLISAGGDPALETFDGPMRPTPHLAACPKLTRVLAALGAVWGRTRLMRLSGHAEVIAHVDVNYYWRERVRLHVPLITQPTVRFVCGDAEVNMAPGEAWIFDTWRPHRVINDAQESRIHLVADTVGSAAFWDLVRAGRSHDRREGWSPRPAALDGPAPELAYETVNSPVVMTPWELRHHLDFLVSEAQPQEAMTPVAQACARFVAAWHGLWSRYGEAEEGWPAYYAAMEGFGGVLRRMRAERIQLRNGSGFFDVVVMLVLMSALSAHARKTVEGAVRSGPAPVAAA